MKKLITIDGMHCGKCASRVEGALKALGGKGKVDLKAKTAVFECARDVADEEIKEAVESLGFVFVSAENI